MNIQNTQRKSRRIWWLGGAVLIILGYFLYDSYSQPKIQDLPGDFDEVAFVRNEQNKGGIIRIYAVTVGNPADAHYEACADMFPVNDYGSLTKVYFFDKSAPYPTELNLEEPHFDPTKYKAIRIIKRSGTN